MSKPVPAPSGRWRSPFSHRLILMPVGILLGVLVLFILDGLSWLMGIQLSLDDSVVPIASLIVLYLLYLFLALTKPQLLPGSHWRFTYTYLIALFVITLIVGFFSSPQLRFLGYIIVSGLVVQARIVFGKRGTVLAVVVLLFAVVLDLILIDNQVMSTIPVLTPLQLGVWLAALAFLHTFTGLGIQERTARLRNEKLLGELREAQTQLQAYALHAEELATMRERARVAREVHDTLAQGFAAVKMHLETGSVLFDEQPERAREHMERARMLAGEHLHEARRTILELRIDAVDEQSLTTSLTKLAATTQTDTTTVGFCAAEGVEGVQLTPAVALACYRIAQEAVHNALRHGKATQIDIELSREGDDLCLTITDNGNGFESETPRLSGSGGGFGIVGMRERIRLLQGRLDIISAPGAGTQVVAMLPLHIVQSKVPL